MKYGLAMSGGGTRGATHVGVLKALEEAGLLPTSVAGTSAGSIAAGLYASGLAISQLYEMVHHLSKHGSFYLDPNVADIIKLIPQVLGGKKISLTGLFAGRRLERLLCDLLGNKTVENVPVPFVIPAVDLKTGNTIAFTNFTAPKKREGVVWKTEGPLCRVIMASSSVPGVFSPQEMEELCLVDGGVTNNLPVDLLMAAGEDRVIAVDIGVDYETPHDDSIVEILSHSYSIMSHSLKNCMSQGELLLLTPPLPKGAGLLTFRQMDACMEEGYEYTKSMIPKIHKALERTASGVKRLQAP